MTSSLKTPCGGDDGGDGALCRYNKGPSSCESSSAISRKTSLLQRLADIAARPTSKHFQHQREVEQAELDASTLKSLFNFLRF